METTERTFSSAEVCGEVGCTYRQLDYMCRDLSIWGQAMTPGTGKGRRFTHAQVGRVREIMAAKRIAAAILEAAGL